MDANARIGDGEAHLTFFNIRLHFERNLALFRGELHCIVQQIDKDLF